MKKTKKMLAGVSVAFMGVSLTGCGNDYDVPSDVNPDTTYCEDWEWNDNEEVYQCEEKSSRYYGHYYFGGRYFSGLPLLRADKSYQTYKSTASSFSKPTKITNGKPSGGKSGFGSGSVGGFGG